MSMTVNEKKTGEAPDHDPGSSWRVVIDGDDFDELSSPSAMALAIRDANAHGYVSAAIEPDVRVLAVDEATDEIIDMEVGGGNKKIKCWRTEITFVKRA